MAAEQMRLLCYAMELDPGYVAVAPERLAQQDLELHRLNPMMEEKPHG